MILKSILHKLIQDKILIFLTFVFFLVLLIKCVAFIKYTGFYNFPLNSYKTMGVWGMYFGVCGFFASFVLITKWKWWIVILSLILDIWLVGNLLYWRSYNDLLSVFSLEDAGNLTQFWTSIFLFFEWKDILFLLLTIILILVMIYLPNKKQINIFLFFLSLSCSILLTYPQVRSMKIFRGYNLFSAEYITNSYLPNIYHCISFTPINYLILQISGIKAFVSEKKPAIDINEINPFLQKSNDTETEKKYNLILVIFESLETWVINSEINNQQITPNINKLYSGQNVLFADKVTDQTKHGKSMDGQMIINTGLLPIYKGATSNRYFKNFYFSLAKAYPKHTKSSFIGNNGECWNEIQTTINFGYDTLFTNLESDYSICKIATEKICDKPYIFQIVTTASHTPFKDFPDSSSLITPNNMPAEMARYIKTINYTDKTLGILLERADLDNTIIMITGDHIIFYDQKRELFKNYCKNNEINIPVEKKFTPLIIYSPEFEKRITVTDTVYQMDIYPTLLHLLHRENYIWKGFGINLSDPNAKRKITPDDAQKLSDAIIRNDYFKNIEF